MKIILAEGMTTVHCGLLDFNFLSLWRWQWIKGREELLAREIAWWGDGDGRQKVKSLTRIGLGYGRIRAQAGTGTVAVLDRVPGKFVKDSMNKGHVKSQTSSKLFQSAVTSFIYGIVNVS